MATLSIPTQQAIDIQKATLARLGVSEYAPVIEGIHYNSDGRVDVQFYLPREELETIINSAGREATA